MEESKKRTDGEMALLIQYSNQIYKEIENFGLVPNDKLDLLLSTLIEFIIDYSENVDDIIENYINVVEEGRYKLEAVLKKMKTLKKIEND